MRGLKKDLQDHIYHTAEMRLQSNPTLGVVATPEMSEEEFSKLSSEAAEREREAEVEKLRKQYETKIKRIQAKISKEEREAEVAQAHRTERSNYKK